MKSSFWLQHYTLRVPLKCLIKFFVGENGYHKAVESDNKFALYKLGEFYELGKGIYQNEVRIGRSRICRCSL